MTRIELEKEILRLPVEEQLALAEVIWERMEKQAQPLIPDWQKDILDERIRADDADPDAGAPWEEVKRRILADL